jgi:AhpD family alkylhydroperoxidase
MNKFRHLDVKTAELAAISASISGGCLPCLNYHFKKAIEIGCTVGQQFPHKYSSIRVGKNTIGMWDSFLKKSW